MIIKREETFHPRLIIVEHIADIINRIDVHTEKLIYETKPSDEDVSELNELRQKQISQLEKFQMLNLAANMFMTESFEDKWASLIEDSSVSYVAKMDQVKHDLIVIDCVLVEDKASKSKLAVWVFRWFNNAANVMLLK